MSMRSVVSFSGLRRLMEGANVARRSSVSGLRCFSNGKILGEEERAQENIFIQAKLLGFSKVATPISDRAYFPIQKALVDIFEESKQHSIQKMERERLEKAKQKAEREKAEKEKADKKAEEGANKS